MMGKSHRTMTTVTFLYKACCTFAIILVSHDYNNILEIFSRYFQKNFALNKTIIFVRFIKLKKIDTAK